MKIRLAETAGFCMGVRRAVDMALDLRRSKLPAPIVTYGPLIHNPQTLELLASRGICEASSLEEIREGTVVIRAHGISPQERDILSRKGIGIIDATCPRVARVQAVIKKHAAKGQFCVIVGDADHPEVRGLMGFATAGGVAVPSAEEIPEDIPTERDICVVAQTTQETDNFHCVVNKLKQICGQLHVYDTICDSTRRRQTEVSNLARQVDLVVVVGGKGSGNTQRLARVAEAQGVPALHVETDEELPPALIAAARTVGVTAGASTPNWQIRRVIERIKQIGMTGACFSRLRRSADVLIMTYCWAAAAGSGLTAACVKLQGKPVTALPLLVSALFVFSMHLLNRIQERAGAVRFNTPEIAAFYARHRTLLTTLGLLSAVGAAILSYQMGTISCALLLGMLITGRMYTVPLPAWLLPGLKWRSLKDLPGSKTPLVAFGWATCAAVLPIIGLPDFSVSSLVISFLFATCMVFWRTALSDLLDIQGDRIVGRETIPILIGVTSTRRLLVALLVFVAAMLGGSAVSGLISPLGYLLILNTQVFFLCFIVYKKRHLVDRLLFEAITDGNIILAGLLSAVM